MGKGGGIGGVVGGVVNGGIGAMTGGAWTPDGRGWTQGNDVGSALGYSYSGGLYDRMGDKMDAQSLINSIPNIARPDYPGYQSVLDNNNNLPAQFQLNANTQGLDKLKAEAMGTGPTPWAASQINQINANKGNMIAANGMQAQANNRQASSAVAQQGGLSSAAQKRIQEQSNRSKLFANQAASRQATQNTQNVMTADAQQKDQNLAALPQMQLEAMNPQMTNIQNTLTQKSARDTADLERYKTEVSSWASANTAKAIEKSGSGKK